MKTLRMLGDRQSEVIEVPEPAPQDDLVVVKMMSSVVCGSEHGAYYAVPPVPDPVKRHGGAGHEGAGVVWRVDGARRFKEGDHVTIAPMPEGCGRCHACGRGDLKHCENTVAARTQSGTHTQYMLLPESCCLPVPEDMSFDVAAMIDDCLGTPYRAISRLDVRAGETVLVTGAGPIGASAAILAGFRNAQVIVVDVNDYRLKHAAHNGADHALNPEQEDALERVLDIAPGGVDVAIECSGMATAQSLCLDATRACGRVAFLGIKNQTISVNMMAHFVYKELTLIGSWAGTVPEHFELIDLIRAGLPADRILTHRFGMDDAPLALDTFFGGQAVKVAIHPWAE